MPDQNTPKAMFKLQFVTISTDTNKRQVLDVIVLDAAVSELHESEAEVTEFPVEQGSDISDNVRMLPSGLKVEAVFTDGHLASYREGTVNNAPAQGKSAKGKLAALESYQAKGTLIDVETGLKSYQNMVIKSVVTPRDSKTGKNAVRTTIILKRIIVAQSQTVVIKQASPKGQPSVPKGPKTAKTADATTKTGSYATKVKDFADAQELGKKLSDSAKALVGGLF